jgi:hypothetical protein
MEAVDFTRLHKDLYRASKVVQEVTAERGVFLAVDGQGAPGEDAFRNAIERLYTVAYTLRHQLRGAEGGDFKVPRLECLWTFDDPQRTAPDEWRWRLLLRVPATVTSAHLKAARSAVAARKGLDARDVRRIAWREGRGLQRLHVGPYDAVAGVYRVLEKEADRLGYRVRGPVHEVYLNDPQRVPPEKLRTIVRLPVAHARPSYARAKHA